MRLISNVQGDLDYVEAPVRAGLALWDSRKERSLLNDWEGEELAPLTMGTVIDLYEVLPVNVLWLPKLISDN